jgi:hypothetical protein
MSPKHHRSPLDQGNFGPMPPQHEVQNHPVRTAVRFPMRLPIEIRAGGRTVQAITENISANGVLFAGPGLPAVDSRIEFTMTMPAAIMGSSSDVEIHCAGRIVRRRQFGSDAQAAAIIDEYFLRV